MSCGPGFPKWVIHDRTEPARGPAISAVPRLRPIFAVRQHFAMCHEETSARVNLLGLLARNPSAQFLR
jgi:hypothetical protein